jgi:hypothetical protein
MPKNIAKEEVNIGEIIFHWTVKEYETPERNKRWYMAMGVVGALLVAYALITANYLFSLLIILFAIILFVHDMVEPIDVDFAITQTGIIVGKKYYTYSELKNFWMIYNPPQVKNLYFSMDSFLRHRIQIPLLDYDPRPIRDYLNQFLQEDLEQEDEPVSDRVTRLFKL